MARISSDSFYVRDCQQIQSGTVAVQSLAGQISRQIHLAESEHDLSAIQDMIDRAVSECADIQLLLKRFQEYTDGTGTLSMPECTSRKRMQRTLSENVTVTARVLEDIIQSFLTLCREKRAADIATAESVSLLDSFQSEPKPAAGGRFGNKFNEGIDDACNIMLTVSPDELERQRLESITKVESDMVALKQIYTDLNQAAATQQQYFDSIESHLLESGACTHSAVNEFLIADTREKNSWKRRTKATAVLLGILIALYFLCV